MKRFFYLLMALFSAARLFSYDGAVSGHKKLFVQKTVWFDVIYAEENEKTARILISNADRIYEEAAGQYGIEPQCRMPLVISQKVEEFNANWSSYPYNHIVIYDTSALKELQLFEDTLLSVFCHEITHSITFNMKNGFWKGVSKVFGDPIYPASLTISRGMAEGAAVAGESAYGEGRLNDEFFRHMVKQAKIEEVFPAYRDVQGASDKYPMGAFYNFNGEFAAWIQKKYSLEQYTDFWYRLVNFKSISANGAFEKAFGQSLNSAWKEFEEAYEVPLPKSQKNPVEAGFSRDFFKEDGKTYSRQNSSGALYSHLKKSDAGLIFIDSKTKSLYFADRTSLFSQSKKITPKKLFTLTSMESADISSDGRFISIITSDSRAATPKSRLKIYDRKSSSFFDFKDGRNKISNISEGIIVKNAGEYYLVCQLYDSPQYKIPVYKMEGKKFKKISEITLPYGTKAGSFAGNCPENEDDSKNGAFTFIKKAGLTYSICTYTFDGTLIYESPLPEKRAAADYISYDTDSRSFYFSYTLPGSMPRLAAFNPETKLFYFSQKDLSGGVFNPVCVGNKIFYIGKFYRQNRLLLLNESLENLNKDFSESEASEKKDSITKASGFLPSPPYEGELSQKKYSRLNFMKGIFLPFSTVTSTSYNYGYKSAYSLPMGLTYLNSNPWTKGFFTLSAGYGLATNSAGIQAGWQSGSYTDIFNYQLSAGSEFDGLGWKQADGSLGLNSTIPFGRLSRLILSEKIYLHYGRSNLANSLAARKNSSQPGYARAKNEKKYFYAADAISLGYSNIHKAGDGKYSNLGFSLSASFISRYNANNKSDLEKYDFYNDPSFSASLVLPRLLPLHDDLWLTYNLPTSISLNILNNSASSSSFALTGRLQNLNFPEFNAASLGLESILFAVEIQKGAGIVFFNDFRIAFHYKAGFSYSEEDDDDSWRILDFGGYLKNLGSETALEQLFGLKIAAGITPNYGNLANYLFKGDCWLEGGIGLKDSKSYAFASLGIKTAF